MVDLILRNREFLKINYSPCVSWPSFCFCSNVNVICSNVNLLGNINISHELYKNVWLTPYRFKTRNIIYLEFNKVNTFLFRTILLSIIDFWRKEPHTNNKYMEVVTRYISVLKQKWIKMKHQLCYEFSYTKGCTFDKKNNGNIMRGNQLLSNSSYIIHIERN